MSRSQAWKALERTAAAVLPDGQRVTEKGASVPDAVGTGWVAECKLRKSFLHHRLFREEKKKRNKLLGRRRFVLVTREKGREALAVLRLRDFEELVKQAQNGLSEPAQGVLFDGEG